MPASVSLDQWIARGAIAFSLDDAPAFGRAVDRLLDALGGASIDLLGLGEAMHGGEEFLLLRNQLLAHLVDRHGYSAIAIESSYPRGWLVNDYVMGDDTRSLDEVMEAGFSHSAGKLVANRELVAWMRAYNADVSQGLKVQFYGFDSPTEMTGTDSPRKLLAVALEYLRSIDGANLEGRAKRIEHLLGNDADWENPAAMMDPTKSIGLSDVANALRLETEELITDLRVRRPELVSKTGVEQYLKAEQHAVGARYLLTYHAGLARATDDRLPRLLGIRDLTMGENLVHVVVREQHRARNANASGGKVLAYAHNSHLKLGQAKWQLGPHALAWWPAGAHAAETMGSRYAVIGGAVGCSIDNGIASPESGTLEARLTASPGPIRFMPTRRGKDLSSASVAALPTRTASVKNHSYFPMTAESLSEFNALLVFDSVTYNRGGPTLPG